MEYKHDGILFSHNKKGNFEIILQHKWSLRICVKWNISVTKRQILYDFPYTRYLVKSTESRMVVAKDRLKGNGQLLFNKYRISVLQDEKN